MRYYRYWGLLVIILFVAAVSLYLFIPRSRQRDILKSNISGMSEESGPGPHMPSNKNEMRSFPKQLKLLGASWSRDPFSLEPLKKGRSEPESLKKAQSGNVKNIDSDLITSPDKTLAATPDRIPTTASAPEHIPTPAATDEHVTTTATINERLYNLNLTGIVFFDNQYMALINDSGVREGETISGFKITEIKRNYVVMKDGSGNYYTLEL